MSRQPSICLCMIVKNESGAIERCLKSVRGLLTTWVISDTGSEDGTQDIIRDTLRGIPGELHEEPWVNFGHNRSLNISHAYKKADYLLLLDADLEIRQEEELPPLTAAAYMLRHEGPLEYRIRRLVRGDVTWRYEGVTHEYLTTDEPIDQANLDALVVVDHADGGSRHDKFERDARLLTAELERDPRQPPAPSSTWPRPCVTWAGGKRPSPCTSAAPAWAAGWRRSTSRSSRSVSSRPRRVTGRAPWTR